MDEDQFNEYKIEIVDGKVVPPDALELIVSDHCNISCRHCNHASPVMRKWNLSPDRVYSDLKLLSKYYAPKRLKLIGGEPLLNPQLAEIAKAARASGIAPHIYVVTNGLVGVQKSCKMEIDSYDTLFGLQYRYRTTI